MSPLLALLLGLVEGVTEYLPVSSTGHLILTRAAYRWVTGATGDSGAYEIVIQLGAVLAVVAHYRTTLAARCAGLVRRDPESIRLLVAVVVAFLPIAVMGLLLRRVIKLYLFGPSPVAVALVAGGILMIAVERWRRGRAVMGESGLEKVTLGRAFAIGMGQCLALWPGASRSMCTIVAGQLAGLSTATAAEFSFLLALPTLGAATVYECVKARHELAMAGGVAIAIGFFTSFVVAWAVIAGFLRYLARRGLTPFGYYRIVLALAVWIGSGLGGGS